MRAQCFRGCIREMKWVEQDRGGWLEKLSERRVDVGLSLISGFDGTKLGMRQVRYMALMSLKEYQILLSLGAMCVGDGEEDWRLVNRASVSFLSRDGSSPHLVIYGER